MSDNTQEVKEVKQPRLPKLWEAVIPFLFLIAMLMLAIIHYGGSGHIPMFLGACFAMVMGYMLGFDYDTLVDGMVDTISRSMSSMLIIFLIGVLTGTWIAAGVIPAMIYYGLKILSPSIFLLAVLLICSITSLATGSSWGTVGTMGIAMLGIGMGLGVPVPVTAGAVISGAYFGDKMSPMSDTTNLAPAMAGTDVFTHIGAMMTPTTITYVIVCVLFTVYGIRYAGGEVDAETIDAINTALLANYKINPLLILPPIVVIAAAILKRGAMEGISLGILVGLALGWIFQGSDGCGLGVFFDVGLYGVTIETGNEICDTLLNRGGMMSIMESCGLAFMAMCFGGIMEQTKQMEVILNALTKKVQRPGGLVAMTEVTCFLSNCFMPDQYIAIIMPGRMFAEVNVDLGLHPKTLSNALESSATVTSSLIPWNSCGVYMTAALGIPTFTYLPYCWFNILMPFMNIILAYMGLTVWDSEGRRLTNKEARDAFKVHAQERRERIAAEMAAGVVEIEKKDEEI